SWIRSASRGSPPVPFTIGAPPSRSVPWAVPSCGRGGQAGLLARSAPRAGDRHVVPAGVKPRTDVHPKHSRMRRPIGIMHRNRIPTQRAGDAGRNLLWAETCCTSTSILQEPEPGGELVGGEPRDGQPLVRAVVVLGSELREQRLQPLDPVPGPLGQP